MKENLKKLLYRPNMKKHLGLVLTGFLLGIIVFGFIQFDESSTTAQFVLSGLLGILICYLVFYSNKPLNNIISWKTMTGLRILAGIFFNALSGYLCILLGVWIYNILGGEPFFFGGFEFEMHLKLIIILFCTSLIYNIFYFAFYSYNQYAIEQIQELKIQRKQSELQLAALKAQLSPHFLFNCINSLSSLFHTNIGKAETFIRSMATSYQYTLENYRKSLIKVRQELEFIESYTYLLKTRFGDGFRLAIDLEESHLESNIPPLTLQILVENAVKHNVISSEAPILVSITGDDSSIKVSNNGMRKKVTRFSTGLGLKNISSRYKILADSKVHIDDSDYFTVTLPVLEND